MCMEINYCATVIYYATLFADYTTVFAIPTFRMSMWSADD